MQSMEEIYQRYAQTVYRYLLSLTHDSDLAEELTQETFYQALRGIDKFNESCKISTWLCAIAKNQLYSYYRKHPPMESLEDNTLTMTSTAIAASAEAEVLSNLDQAELMKKLQNCPEAFREILYMRIFGNLSFKEIGDIVGKTENWARVTYYRGKERLRKEMERDGK